MHCGNTQAKLKSVKKTMTAFWGILGKQLGGHQVGEGEGTFGEKRGATETWNSQRKWFPCKFLPSLAKDGLSSSQPGGALLHARLSLIYYHSPSQAGWAASASVPALLLSQLTPRRFTLVVPGRTPHPHPHLPQGCEDQGCVGSSLRFPVQALCWMVATSSYCVSVCEALDPQPAATVGAGPASWRWLL